MASSTVNLQALGLNFSPNALELPPGSLVEADNVIIRRDDVIESRRGYKLYGEEIPSQQKAKQLMVYRDRILRHYGSKIAFEDGLLNDGTAKFTEFSGDYSETEQGLRIKSVQEENGNFYFTTSGGIKKISAADGSELSPEAGYITQAGGIKALDLNAELSYPSENESGFLLENSVVSYKLVWGKTDSNNVQVLGSPSQEAVVYNPLRTLLALNFNNLLYILDKFKNTDALFKADSSKTLFSTLAATIDTNAIDLRQKFVDLAEKLDEDEVFAKDSATGAAYAPLDVGSVTASSGIITIAFPAASITGISAANPTVITSASHGLTTGQTVYITGSNSTPSIDGIHTITVTNTNTFSIPVYVTGAGNAGKWTKSFPSKYFSTDITSPKNLNIYLSGFKSNGVEIENLNGAQTIQTVSDSPAQLTLTPEKYSATDSVGISGGIQEIPVTVSPSFPVTADITNNLFTYDTTVNCETTANSAVIKKTGHTFQVGDVVVCKTSAGGFVDGTTYYVVSATPKVDFQLSESSGGPSVSATSTVTLGIRLKVGFIEGEKIKFSFGTGGSVAGGINTTDVFYARTTSLGETFQVSSTPSGSIIDLTSTGSKITAQKVNVIPITTSSPHGLKDGQKVEILNSSCYPTINGTYPITVISDTKFSIEKDILIEKAGASGQWNIVIDTIGEIQSNKYRSIDPQPVEPAATDFVGTGEVLFSLKDYLSSIIDTLNLEDTNVISKSTAKTNGLTDFSPKSSANVELTFTVPKEIDSTYYYQLYRTTINTIGKADKTALEQAEPLTDYRLLKQEYFTGSPSGVLSLTDDVEESFLTGAFLYTNSDLDGTNNYPPVAKDIASFKGRTFYSNVKLKQQFILNLIGVTQFKNKLEATPPETPKLLFADSTGNNVCEVNFVLAKKQVSTITTFSTPSDTPTYFDLYSANNTRKYRFWYGTDSAPPAPSGFELVQINMNGAGNPAQYSQRIAYAVNLYLNDFKADVYYKSFTASSGNGTITLNSHGLSDNVKIRFIGNYLPDGIAEDIDYYVMYDDANTFQVSLSPSPNAVAIPFTTSGNGFIKVLSATPTNDAVVITNSEDGVSTPISASGLTVSTPLNGVGEDAATKTVAIPSSNLIDPATQAELTIKSLIRVINRNTVSVAPTNNFDLYAYYVDYPASVQLEGRQFKDDEFYPLTNIKEIGESFSPDISPSIISGSGISTTVSSSDPVTLTFSSAHNFLNGDTIVIIDSKSTPSIDGAYKVEYVSSTQLKIYPNKVITGSAISPVFKFINAIESERSSNFYQKNAVYYSKIGEPESVPQKNVLPIGAEEMEILRIFHLRDSLFVFKEDGLFRVTADYATPLATLFDSSCILIAPDSVAVSRNNVYGWTTQGIQYVNESGATLISRPIDTEVFKVASSTYPSFKTATFGVGYESDNSYIVWTVKETTDSVATQALRFSSVTNTWTKYQKKNTCGLVRGQDDKMYLGATDVSFIEQERKSFTREDYADREYSFNIPSTSWLPNKQVILTSVDNVREGDVFFQEQGLTVYQFNSLLKKIDNDPSVIQYRENTSDTFRYYTDALKAKYGDNMRDKLVELAADLDSDGAINDSTFSSTIGSLSSLSITNISYSNPLQITTSSNHGLFTGRQVIISGVASVPDINGVFTATKINNTTFSIPVTLLDYVSSLTDFVSTADNSIQDIKVCFNKIVEKLNNDTFLSFSNYMPVPENTKQETIITSVNRTTKTITLEDPLDFVVGGVKVFNAIPCSVVYAPNAMGDPLGFKHFSQATMLFANKGFSSATLSFATDLLPEFIDIKFFGDGAGTFGNDNFGDKYFGGGSNYIPFRTYIPRQCQRCRYLTVKFAHRAAREQFNVFGLTLTGRTAGTRAYR